MTAEYFKNQFLVALTSLAGDYFQNTLTLLIDHSESGAFGLIVNRPLDHSIWDIFPELPAGIECPVMEGGPVEQDKMFFLHGPFQPDPQTDTIVTFESSLEVAPGLYLTTSKDIVRALHDGKQPRPLMGLLGYAGWGPLQLERELGENTWLLTPSNQDILFRVPAQERAEAAAQLLGVDLNLIAPKAGHD
jgi:putative transcriptional regulator